jgi:hypothetical protein
MRIERGGSVHFQTSLCPLPLINIGSLDRDWYEVGETADHLVVLQSALQKPQFMTQVQQSAVHDTGAADASWHSTALCTLLQFMKQAQQKAAAQCCSMPAGFCCIRVVSCPLLHLCHELQVNMQETCESV